MPSGRLHVAFRVPSMTQFANDRDQWKIEPAPYVGRPLGQILLDCQQIDRSELKRALELQSTTRARLGEILIGENIINEEQVAAALAMQCGLGYANLSEEVPDPIAFRPEDLDIYLRHRIVPWRRVGNLVAYATAEPYLAQQALDELNPGTGLAFFVVAGRAAIDQALLKAAGPELAERAARRVPGQYSVRGFRPSPFLAMLALAFLGLLGWYAGTVLLAIVAMAILLLNLGTMATRLAALGASVRDRKDNAEEARTLVLADHRPLPVISILVPLYDEAEMVTSIVDALDGLDYPHALLDVKLLLEEGDERTRRAVAEADLPGWVRPMILPDGQPRTKPRAMNLALDFCEGEIVGILDAEDRPDRDQLRKVAHHLAHAPRETACVQCGLTWFNARENWITRCFLIEYAIWFDVLLRGFQRLGLPIPLGGTSVYFRRSALVTLEGWDAHNVTEDADLGMRLARQGWHCAVIDSTTHEEANCKVLPWIRQRSRWLKGFVMTWANHMRDPVQLWKELGAKGFLGLNILFLGGAVTYLAMPLFWIALTLTLVSGDSVYGNTLPDLLVTVLGISLAVGQGVMLACALLALKRRAALGMAIWVLTLPVYWTMGAVAAWKAVIEIFWAPFYWDKTQHGVSKFCNAAATGPDANGSGRLADLCEPSPLPARAGSKEDRIRGPGPDQMSAV